MISVEEFVERLCLVGADRGPRRFPRRRVDRRILMKSIVLLLDSARTYTEPEINAILRDWKRTVAPAIETDHVTVRRLLVDYGHLERTADGRTYRVGFPPASAVFDLDVDELDLRSTVAAFLDHRAREAEAAAAARAAVGTETPSGPGLRDSRDDPRSGRAGPRVGK